MPRAGSSTHEGGATLHVRRLAGEVAIELLDGPATSHQLCSKLGAEQRSMQRAIRELENWGVELEVTRPGRLGHKGSLPYVYALTPRWKQQVSAWVQVIKSRPSMAAGIALALEGSK